jgi:hypothetical protein
LSIVYATGPARPIFRSTDGGETWEVVESELGFVAIAASANGSTVAACKLDGTAFISFNGGDDWTSSPARGEPLNRVAISPDGGRIRFTAPDDSVFEWQQGVGYGDVGPAASWSDIVLADELGFGIADGGPLLIDRFQTSSWVTVPLPTGAWKSVAAARDGSVAYVAGTGTQIARVSLDPLLITLRGPVADYTSLAVSEDGSTVIAGTTGGQVVVSHDSGDVFFPAGIVENWTDVAVADGGNILFGAESRRGVTSIGRVRGGNAETVRLMYNAGRGWVPVSSHQESVLESRLEKQETLSSSNAGFIDGLRESLDDLAYSQIPALNSDLIGVQAAVSEVSGRVEELNADKVNLSGDVMKGGLTVPELRVNGLVRLGSETGTTIDARYGIVTRRVRSLSSVGGEVVARAPGIVLERTTNYGQFKISWDRATLYSIIYEGIRSNGERVQAYVGTYGESGSHILFSGLSDVVQMNCTFGSAFSDQPTTEVRLFRYAGDFYWVGFLTSSLNQ